jgi:hypothetical protein
MKLFELLPCVDLPGQRSLTVAPPIDLLVKQAMARLERRPSRQWLDATRDMETGHAVRLEVSLEELALSSNELTIPAADSKTSRR